MKVVKKYHSFVNEDGPVLTNSDMNTDYPKGRISIEEAKSLHGEEIDSEVNNLILAVSESLDKNGEVIFALPEKDNDFATRLMEELNFKFIVENGDRDDKLILRKK